MSGTKISAGADPGTLVATDKLPLARSASTTAYAATMAEVATYANGAYVPPYYTGTPIMDGTGAAGTATFVSHGDHVHPSDVSRAPLASPTFTGVPAAPTPTTGTNTTQIATTAFVQSQMVASGAGVSTWNTRAGAVVLQQADIVAVGALHDVGRNLLHNALFNVAQRGAGPFTSGYTADRWSINTSLDTASVSRGTQNDINRVTIGDEAATYYLQNAFTGNSGAGAWNYLGQPIEDVRRLAGKTITASFWAVASVAGLKLGVNALQSFGTGGSPSAVAWAQATGASVTLTTSWTRYSTSIVIPNAQGKTLGTNGDHYTALALFYSAGTGTNAIAGNIGVQSGAIYLWGVQLEVGSVATPLEKPDPADDLSNCQRFYWTSPIFGTGYNAASNAGYFNVWLPTAMRATPTMTLVGLTYSNASGATITPNGPSMGSVFMLITATGLGYVSGGTVTASADL